MTHPVSFGLEIPFVVFIRYNFDRYIFYNFETISFQANSLDRVVSEQTHLVNSQLAQHLCTASIVALIWLEAEMCVGIHCVIALFLQLVCSNLVHQTDASTFLLHVYDYTLSFFFYHFHCSVQLLSAVAAHASQDVACST